MPHDLNRGPRRCRIHLPYLQIPSNAAAQAHAPPRPLVVVVVAASLHVPALGIDPTKIQLSCADCKAILNMPRGLVRFSWPQCAVELAVDMSKFKQLFPPPPPPPPPEEVNEVAIEVEQEEDEGGMVG